MNELERAVDAAASQGSLPCATAFAVGDASNVSPRAVREAADRSGIRISLCQLGLFGYEEYGEKRWARGPVSVPAQLEAETRAACVEGRLPCAGAWRLADERGLPRLLVGSIAEAIGVRVSSCQLGCFD